jgi:hypothetical protein
MSVVEVDRMMREVCAGIQASRMEVLGEIAVHDRSADRHGTAA